MDSYWLPDHVHRFHYSLGKVERYIRLQNMHYFVTGSFYRLLRRVWCGTDGKPTVSLLIYAAIVLLTGTQYHLSGLPRYRSRWGLRSRAPLCKWNGTVKQTPDAELNISCSCSAREFGRSSGWWCLEQTENLEMGLPSQVRMRSPAEMLN
jgi:hypothetical protein